MIKVVDLILMNESLPVLKIKEIIRNILMIRPIDVRQTLDNSEIVNIYTTRSCLRVRNFISKYLNGRQDRSSSYNYINGSSRNQYPASNCIFLDRLMLSIQ